jgi:predicted Zn-dependent protease
MRRLLLLIASLVLVSCGPTYQVPPAPRVGGAQVAVPLQPGAAASRSYAAARAEWDRVIPRVRQQAVQFCLEEHQGRPAAFCDFQIRLIEDPRAPPNAFQTVGRDGRPLLVMTSNLLGDTRSADEIAFVMAHEASHHIAGHLERQRANVALGALILGSLAQATIGAGTDPARADRIVSDAMDLGAFAGSRAYSQAFELEADTLGAFIAARAGYSPEAGALMFHRTPSASGPGSLISSHPPSRQRLATVNQVAQEIRRQQALGQVPRPGRGRI